MDRSVRPGASATREATRTMTHPFHAAGNCLTRCLLPKDRTIGHSYPNGQVCSSKGSAGTSSPSSHSAVWCPEGYQAVGGGYAGDPGTPAPSRSMPLMVYEGARVGFPESRGWEVEGPDTMWVSVYAICVH